MLEEYKTIKSNSKSYFKEKSSKFYSFAFPVQSEAEIKERLKELKSNYKDAGHHCYAFKLGSEGKNYRYSDDGEPNNSAGKPIYGQLNSFGVTNVLVVVVRYFGGTKLGVGGLVQAYKEGAKNALENAQIITKEVTKKITLNFKYEDMNTAMSLIKTFNLDIISQQFDLECLITLEVSIKKEKKLIQKLNNYPQLELVKKETI